MPDNSKNTSFDSKQLTIVQRLTNAFDAEKTKATKYKELYNNLLKDYNELKASINSVLDTVNTEIDSLSKSNKQIEFEPQKDLFNNPIKKIRIVESRRKLTTEQAQFVYDQIKSKTLTNKQLCDRLKVGHGVITGIMLATAYKEINRN